MIIYIYIYTLYIPRSTCAYVNYMNLHIQYKLLCTYKIIYIYIYIYIVDCKHVKVL